MKFTGIAAKVWLSIGIFAVGYLVSIAIGQYQGHATEGRLRATAHALFPIAQKTQDSAESFNRMVRSFNDAVMTENESALEQAATEGTQTVKSLRAASALPGVAKERQAALLSLATNMERLTQEGRSVYGAMLKAKENITPEIQQRSQSLASRVDATKQTLQAMADQTSKDLQAELQSLETNSVWQRNFNLGVLIATLVVSFIIINRTIRNSVVGPIYRVVRGVETAASAASLASDQVARSGGQVANSANEQASYLQQTSASLNQIAAMTRSNSERATQADLTMMEVRQQVETTTGTMKQLTVAMNDISEASHQVAGILKTIEEIAFLTNILALNAAVEAARAGEAGAGFSVVADEVRSLAHRSSEAAKNTAELVEGTLAKVEGGTKMVRRSAEAFTAIASGILGGSQVVTEIARASEEQRRGIEQISEAVTKMDQVTQANAATAQETASAAANMSAQVRTTRGFIDELAVVVGADTH
jgi:methyl-accepting chemotaxis protein